MLGPGQMSGERALVEEKPPGVTLRAASSAVRVLRLDRGVAVALARAHPEAAAAFSEQAHAQRIAAFLRTDETFRELDAKGVELIVGRGRAVQAHDGDVIAREGERTPSWWIVESGRLVEHTGQEEARRDVRFLRAGDVFGEVGALEGSTRLTTVTAVSDCGLLELDAAVLGELAALDPAFASRLGDRAQLHLSRIATRPLDFGGGDIASGVSQRPPTPPPSPDERMAAGVDVSGEAPAAEPWVAPRRFPFVRQIDFADCGVAALAMICRAFGRKVSLPFIRHIAGTGQEGTSLRGIMRAAEEAGLEGHAFKASKDRLDDLQLPAIIHWEGNHWVVLYAVEGDRVRIADPGRGLRRYPRAEVEEKWSGWCATFRPTPGSTSAPRRASRPRPGLRPFVRPLRDKLALATAMAIVATALQLLAPVLTQRIVDAAAGGHSARVSYLILLTVGLLFLGLGVSLLQRRMLARAAVRLDGEALDFVSGRLLQLPLKYFETRRTADIERRLNGLRQVRALFVQAIVGGLSAVVQLVVTLFIMVVVLVDHRAGVPGHDTGLRGTHALLLGAAAADVRQPRGGVLASRRASSSTRSRASRRPRARAPRRACGAGSSASSRQLADRVFRSDWVLMFYDATVQVAGFLLFILFLWVGALLVARGTLTIGELVAVNSLVLLANAPIAVLLGLWDQAAAGLGPAPAAPGRARGGARAGPDARLRCATCTGCRAASRCARSRSPTRMRPSGGSSTT